MCKKKSIRKSIHLEKLANKNILPYGFKHKEERYLEETYRTEIRRQRDKILYTGGFRRLQDKTQVMSTTLPSDHRTRLTHTLEVEQISISVADALGLNKDLVSAIALGHDVGHTPFGHAAELTLNKLLKDYGGFHHPIESVKYLWGKYGKHLDFEIYEGILLHDSDMFNIDNEKSEKQMFFSVHHTDEGTDEGIDEGIESYTKLKACFKSVPSTLEAQVVIWADKIAYITHDLEDFLNSSIYQDILELEGNGEKIEKDLCKILTMLMENPVGKIKNFKSRNLIRSITTNLIETSSTNIGKIKNLTQDKVKDKTKENLKNIQIDNEEIDKKKQYLNSLIINFEDKFRKDYYVLRDFLNKNYIFSDTVKQSDENAKNVVTRLFEKYTENYNNLPSEISDKINVALKNNTTSDEEFKKYLTYRIAASYISTMSDTFAQDTDKYLTGSEE